MPKEGAADLKADALQFHSAPRPGKLEVVATKPLANQRDLALAYSPGVAFPCEAIAADPDTAAIYTARQNLVAVLSNGTAVLGLGAIGPLAAKPVMEGKAVLFKKFAGIDVFDIEVAETNVDKLVDIIVALEPTFGGINLEDIKGPECFEVEEKAKARMGIPVFHDDQHGTAIIVSAAIVNALELTGKTIGEVKIVCSGAGAAALASLNLLVSLGAKRENITVCDIEGVVYKGREKLMDRWKAVYARETSARTLADAIPGADIFLGLSAGGVLKPEMLKLMASNPLVMALANPTPEIMPELALEARPDVMICTGRSDYPNQVNNVLCFPYIFRGALDAGASEINEAMKKAAVAAIAALARETPSEVAALAYGGESSLFGKTSLIPSPFDPRLMLRIAPAVARAAMESGVARRPIVDFDAYADQLNRFVFRSGFIMKPLFAKARAAMKTVIYSEGEDERVLRATQVVLEERLAKPILIGRPEVISDRIKRFGLTIHPNVDFEIIDPSDDPRYRDYVATYLKLAGRKGVTPDVARIVVRSSPSVIGALALHRGEADALICGLEGRFTSRLDHIRDIIGLAPGVKDLSALVARHRSSGRLFPRRHPCALRSERGGDRRYGDRVCAPRAPLRHRAQDRADLAFRLRLRRYALSAENARGPAPFAGARARPRSRRRNAGRHRAVAGRPPARDHELAPARRGQRADLPQSRCRKHRAAADPGHRRRPAGRSHSDRPGEARACADALGDRARHRQHDGDRGRRSRKRIGASFCRNRLFTSGRNLI